MENAKHSSSQTAILYNFASSITAFLICTCLAVAISGIGGLHGPLAPFLAKFNHVFLLSYVVLAPPAFFYLGKLAMSIIDQPYHQAIRRNYIEYLFKKLREKDQSPYDEAIRRAYMECQQQKALKQSQSHEETA